MAAGNVAHLERLHGRGHFAVAQDEAVGGVVGEAMAAGLRLQQQRERRIAADVDPLDRVHLHGDVQAHGSMRAPGDLVVNVYAILPAVAMARDGIQRLVSKALAMCRGILPGATNMTSKLM